ncbi:MAG: hypothetical protein H6R11_1210 [Proteobacteria bacterium]|nr:hypothetical protein [Pseudomonadota bacterium]
MRCRQHIDLKHAREGREVFRVLGEGAHGDSGIGDDDVRHAGAGDEVAGRSGQGVVVRDIERVEKMRSRQAGGQGLKQLRAACRETELRAARGVMCGERRAEPARCAGEEDAQRADGHGGRADYFFLRSLRAF